MRLLLVSLVCGAIGFAAGVGLMFWSQSTNPPELATALAEATNKTPKNSTLKYPGTNVSTAPVAQIDTTQMDTGQMDADTRQDQHNLFERFASGGKAAFIATMQDSANGHAHPLALHLAAIIDPTWLTEIDTSTLRLDDNRQALMIAFHTIAQYDRAHVEQLVAVLDDPQLQSMLPRLDQLANQERFENDAELAAALAQPNQSNMASLYRTLNKRAQQDPQGTMALLTQQNNPQARSLAQFVFQQWVMRDPADAGVWLTTQDPTLVRENLHLLGQTWASQDFAAAAAYAQTLDGSSQIVYLNGVIESQGKPLDSLLSLLNDYRDHRAYTQLVSRAIMQIAYQDVAAAEQLAAELPEQQQHQIYSVVVGARFQDGPEAAIEWWQDQDLERREHLRPYLAQILAVQDADRALEIARDITNPEQRQKTLSSVAYSLIQYDPEQALQLLPELPQAQQDSLVQRLLTTLPSDRAAAELAQQHGVDDETLFRLRTRGGNSAYLRGVEAARIRASN